MYLGIDIGTSAIKAVLVAANGELLAQSAAALGISSPHHLWSEQNPDDWWQAVQSACQQLPDIRRNIAAIGLSGQMHGLVCLDRDMQIIRPAILWNDGRSYAECEQMQKAMPEIGQLAGVPPMPGFTAPKLLWMQKHEPENHSRIAHILLPKDYIRFRMSGELATDKSDAAGTMWLDQQTRGWSQALCDISACNIDWLPQLYEGTEITGELTAKAAEKLGLAANIPIVAGGGDAAAGAVGIGAVSDGDAFLSLGTSGQLFVVTDSYRANPQSAVHAYAHCIRDMWFQMAAMLNGASPLNWYSSFTGIQIEELLKEAETGRDDDNLLFLPYLTGERTPHNDPHIRAGWNGIGPDTERAAMTRALLDGIAYSFCDGLAAINAAGTNITNPAAIGGGARSDLLLQTIADATGLAIHRCKDALTGPAFGAARLAAIADNGLKIAEIATKPPTEQTFHPDHSRHDRHQQRLARFRQLYRATSPLAQASSD